MRTLLLVFTFLLISNSFVLAQFQSGTRVIGGHFTFEYEKQDDDNLANFYRNTEWGIAPDFGFFVSDKTLIGLRFGYNTSKIRQTIRVINQDWLDVGYPYSYEKLTNKDWTLTMGPYLRHYVLFSDRFGLVLDLQAGLGFGKSRQSFDTLEMLDNSSNRFQLGLDTYPSFVFQLNSKIGLEAAFGGFNIQYSSQQTEKAREEDKPLRKIHLDNQFGKGLKLGLRFYFSRGK